MSRLHCAVTVSEDGRVSVADLGSTNGTSLDGADVHDRPVRLAPGALLRLGESTLRLTSGTRTPTLTTTPDGEGHLRVALAEAAAPGAERAPAAGARTAREGTARHTAPHPPHTPRTGPTTTNRPVTTPLRATPPRRSRTAAARR